ncbi:MAG: PHP domain-containing protein [Magnetococcales bacterium]|nr:PHP domain-containing protein [Magnetococcales bacterium]NGZ05333.1 PHP domain-containing protein [Magnetococcales bacterium]
MDWEVQTRCIASEWFYPADQPMSRLPRWEYHAHSNFSDGSASIVEVIATARDRGMERLIFTEHTEPDLTSGPGWFAHYADTIRTLRWAVADELEVIIGLEVPLIDFTGRLLASEEMLRTSEFILGAVHAYPGYGWDLTEIEPERAIDLEFRGLLALADHPMIDAIAHPGGVCTRYVTPFPMELFEEVVIRAKVQGKAIELNPAYHQPMAPFLEICRRHGVWLSPGSNAHHLDDIGLAYQVLRATPPPNESMI